MGTLAILAVSSSYRPPSVAAFDGSTVLLGRTLGLARCSTGTSSITMPRTADVTLVSDRDADGLRVLLVGLDGVDRTVLETHRAAGRIPTLETLLDTGVVADLESQIPPWTPSAWPSLYTGVNPGKHGVFDFLAFDGYDWRLVDRSDVHEFALWELADAHGVESVVVNVPVTDPPRSFDGALVPGYVAPDDPTCHPEGVLDDVRDAVGDYRVYAPTDVDSADAGTWYRRLVEMRGAAFRHLVDRHDPAFGFVQFQQTDTVFHERPHDEAVVADVFEAVDEQLAAILDACDPDTVFVVSDHGIGPYEGYEFRVNEYLRDAGLLETTTGEGGMPSWTALAREREGEGGRSLTQQLVTLASRVGVTSQRLQTVLSRLHLEGLALRVVSPDTVRAASERVDFARSTAYVRSRTELGVRLNVAGRDPDGVVSPAEYPSVRDDVAAALREVETPDGTRVFEEVGPREDYFHGPFVEDAVDVVTVPTDFQHYLSASLRGDYFDAPSEDWNHKRHGIFVAAGDGVDHHAAVGTPHLFDVAPTVLSALGVPPSDRMDGRMIDCVRRRAPAAYPEFTPRETDAADTEAVERRLANLGYLDDEH